MTNYVAPCGHSVLFWCAKLFSQVSRSTCGQKVRQYWKKKKKDFLDHSYGGIRPFSSLKSVPSGILWCSLWSKDVGVVCQVVFKGFQVHWLPKSERIGKNAKNLIYRAIFTAFKVNKLLKFDPWARFWCSLGPGWGIRICKVVSWCLFVFSRQLEWSKMTNTKKCHL